MSKYYQDEKFELFSVITCLCLMFAYLLYNYFQVLLCHNTDIHLQKTFDNSMYWLKRFRDNGDASSGVMAVQTLRNTILVAVFIGGASFTSGFSILNGVSSENSTIDIMKGIVLSSLFFLSFIAWAGVCRIASQLGYVVGTIPNYYKTHLDHDRKLLNEVNNEEIIVENKMIIDKNEIDSDDEFKELLEAQTMIKNLVFFFSLGFRFLFVAIPFAFISISTIVMLIATGFILILFYLMDHNTSRIVPKYGKMKMSV